MDITHLFHPTTFWLLILIGLFGLCIGSFLNVVIYRLPIIIEYRNHQAALSILDQSIPIAHKKINLCYPPSFCFHCKTKIPIWANLPVLSYLILRGKSLCCKESISSQYLIVELLSGILTLVLTWHFGLTPSLVAGLLLTWSLLVLFFIDLDTLILPDQITMPVLWLGLFVNLFTVFTDIKNAVLGAMIGFTFFYLIALLVLSIRKIQGLGDGDLKLIAALGAWFGWQSLPAMIFIASLSGSLFGIIYLIGNKQKLTTRLPFGPFLSLAGFMMLIWGPNILMIQDSLAYLST